MSDSYLSTVADQVQPLKETGLGPPKSPTLNLKDLWDLLNIQVQTRKASSCVVQDWEDLLLISWYQISRHPLEGPEGVRA